MASRTPKWSVAFVTALVSLTMPLGGCAKKKKAAAATERTPATVATVGGTTATTTAAATDVSIDTAVVTDAAALVIPSSINLIPPKSGSVAALRLADTDFESDPTNVRLKEDMFTPVDKAVGILCFVSQTRGIEFLNQGAYRAYVDGAKCGMDNGGDSAQGAVSYDDVTVRATQDGTKPPRVEMWLSGGNGADIYATLDIAEGPTDSNPLGVLKMRFDEGDKGGGYIETRKFANPDGDGRDRAELLFNNTESGDTAGNVSVKKAFASVYVTAGNAPSDGYASTSTSQSGTRDGQTHTSATDFKAAFNGDFVARAGTTSQDSVTTNADACLDRNGFINYVERYNLYSLAGDRVELQSGRPGECTVDGANVQASFSYYGIWNSANAAASALTDCKFVDYSTGTRVATPIEVVSAPGKLVKYSGAETTLGALKGIELSSYAQGGNLIIKWAGDGMGFQKVAVESCDQSGCNRTAATGAPDANNLWDNSLNFYVPTLDANMSIRIGEASDAYVIYYFSRETVSGTADVPPGDLLCFANCPKMAPTTAEMQWTGGDPTTAPYHTTTITFGGDQTQLSTQAQNLLGSPLATYTFNNTSLVLAESAVPFALPAGLSEQANANIQSGALVPSADFALLTTQQKTQSSGYDLERLVSTFYRWESGSSPWNRFAGVKSGGVFVPFDKPIDLSYSFIAADNMNTSLGSEFYGAPVRLTYGGPGNLWGIPQGNDDNHFAKFSLKSGTEISTYKLKAVQVSQTMSAAAASSCATLQTSHAPNLDSLPPVITPDVAAKPTGDLQLKVIGGELVTAP